MAQTGKKLTIKGDVSKVKEPIKEVLLILGHEKDSCLVKDGKYKFEIKNFDKGQVILQFRTEKGVMIPPPYERFMYRLYAQPGVITLTSTDAASNCKVTGAKWNDDYQEYMKNVTKNLALMKDRTAEINKYMEAKDTMRANMMQNGNTNYLDSLRLDYAIEFAQSHPESPITLELLSSSGGSPFNGERILPSFTKLPVSVQQSASGRELKEKIDKTLNLGIGKILPDFTQPNTLGVPVSLSSYRGKYVLVEFWANWCVFCRAEVPYIKKAFEKYKDKGFDILSVSIDKAADKEKWLKAIQKDGVGDWAQVADLKGTDNEPYKRYGLSGIPANFLVGPQGKVVALNLRGDDLERKLEELLK